MAELTDELLLKEIKNGVTKSLGILYERYKSVLFNYFLRVTSDYDTSNELLMETFERIYKYRHSYKPPKNVRPWIFQIASNLIKDFYKQSNKLVSVETKNLESQEIDQKDFDDSINRNKLLNKALNQLTPSQKNIVSMYYLLEMSYQDIADSENISINNARIKICRSLKKLKELLKDSDI